MRGRRPRALRVETVLLRANGGSRRSRTASGIDGTGFAELGEASLARTVAARSAVPCAGETV